MATSDISLMGAVYPDVPQVVLPKDGGGTTTFTDVSDTTATASDVLNSKYFYNASGEKIQGTATGGGTPAISVVDTADSGGGVVRTITALNISDTTATAADVASGKYFYTADGAKTQGSASGGGVDCPTFTVVLNQSMTSVESVSCDKTYSECYAYRTNNVYYALIGLTIGSSNATYSATNNYLNNTLLYNVDVSGMGIPDIQIQYTSSTLTAVLEPIPWRDSNDLTASNLTVTAPSGYYHSSASKTLTDANLIASNIKSGVSIFGVLGTFAGGSGGLVYESGTYTPTSDINRPTISFTNTHNEPPIFVGFSDANSTASTTTQSGMSFLYFDFEKAFGYGIPYSSSAYRYVFTGITYRGNSSSSLTYSLNALGYKSSDTGTGSAYPSYFCTKTGFYPYPGSTSRYWRNGRTYKWIAIWAQ